MSIKTTESFTPEFLRRMCADKDAEIERLKALITELAEAVQYCHVYRINDTNDCRARPGEPVPLFEPPRSAQWLAWRHGKDFSGHCYRELMQRAREVTR